MEVLLSLVWLACPVGMGLMMWFMSRRAKEDAPSAVPHALDDLRAAQRRLQAEIDGLRRREEAVAGRPADEAPRVA